TKTNSLRAIPRTRAHQRRRFRRFPMRPRLASDYTNEVDATMHEIRVASSALGTACVAEALTGFIGAKAGGCSLPGGRTLRSGAEILHRPRHHLSELARRAKRPVRVARQLTRQEHAVGPVLSDDAIRLSGFRDEADGSGRHAR